MDRARSLLRMAPPALCSPSSVPTGSMRTASKTTQSTVSIVSEDHPTLSPPLRSMCLKCGRMMFLNDPWWPSRLPLALTYDCPRAVTTPHPFLSSSRSVTHSIASPTATSLRQPLFPTHPPSTHWSILFKPPLPQPSTTIPSSSCWLVAVPTPWHKYSHPCRRSSTR